LSISAQALALQVRALIPMPPTGGTTLVRVCPCESKVKSRSCPGRDPPRRHCAPEQATELNNVGNVAGMDKLNQFPLGDENSATDVGPSPSVAVPTATHASFKVHEISDNGTEMLIAGVPLRWVFAITAVVPQLASTKALTPSSAMSRAETRR
jgi:hypothetical protein